MSPRSAFSARLRSALDLLAILALSLLAAGLVASGAGRSTLQTLLLIPFMFVFPGYTLVCALFPYSRLETVKFLIFMFALSFSTTILGGVLLNSTSTGLQTSSWLVYESALILIAGLIALIRRWQRPDAVLPLGSPQLNIGQVGLIVFAILIVFAAIIVSRYGAERVGSRYTQLWLLPDDQKPLLIHVGVHNQEGIALQYSLELKQGNAILQEWDNISLAPNEQWESVMALPPEQADNGTLIAALYRLDQPNDVYRYTSLGVGAGDAAK